MLFPDWLSRWNRISNSGRMPRRGGRRSRQKQQSPAVVVDQLEPRQMLAASMGPVVSVEDGEPIIVAAGSEASDQAATMQSRLDGLLLSALESSRRPSNSLDPVATGDLTGDDRGSVAGRPLEQATPAGRQVVHELGRLEVDRVVGSVRFRPFVLPAKSAFSSLEAFEALI